MALAQALGDDRMTQQALTNLGFARSEQADLDGAVAVLDESLAIARTLDERSTKFPLGILAGALARLGEHGRAAALAAEGLQINRRLDDPEGTADAMRTLATALAGLGDLDRARRLAQQALDAHQALDHELGIGLDLALLGDLGVADGDAEQACAHYRDCLRRWRGRGNPAHTARVLEHAAVLVGTSDAGKAVEVSAAAAAVCAQRAVRLGPAEQDAVDAAHTAWRHDLGATRYEAAPPHRQRAVARCSDRSRDRRLTMVDDGPPAGGGAVDVGMAGPVRHPSGHGSSGVRGTVDSVHGVPRRLTR